MNTTLNKRIDTDAPTAAFVRCWGAGHAQRRLIPTISRENHGLLNKTS